MLSTSVSCLLCGHTAATLARHFKAVHGITADEYRVKFPEARIRSEACETNRRAAISRSHKTKSRAGLKKTISCSSCGTPHEVGLTFAPSTHDARCSKCRAKDEDAFWATKQEGTDFVTCHGCGHRADNLTSHVQNAHPEWVGCYPGQMVAGNSKIRDKTALRGRVLSEETRAKMAASAGWNRGLTKETDERVARAAAAMKGRPVWSTGLTKADHPSLRATAEKLSARKLGVPNDAARLDLSLVDFTPFLDGTGAVDRKLMAQELGISEPTVTKYMKQIGLRLSTKYVDAHVERDLETGHFHDMSRKSAEETTIRLTVEQLEPFKLKNGKVFLGRAMKGLGHVYTVIKRECDRLGIPTHTHLVKQSLCLDAVSKMLMNAPYKMEWMSRAFVNPVSKYMFKFDGFFPTVGAHGMIVEFHGYQHYVFPNVFHKTEEDFKAGMARDKAKEEQVLSDGRFLFLVVREDEPYTDEPYLRQRYLDLID